MARPPTVSVGFNYSIALLRIGQHRTYSEIARFCGYDSPASVYRVIRGQIPPHPVGEAIWSLYVELFGEKPPFEDTDIPYMEQSLSST